MEREGDGEEELNENDDRIPPNDIDPFAQPQAIYPVPEVRRRAWPERGPDVPYDPNQGPRVRLVRDLSADTPEGQATGGQPRVDQGNQVAAQQPGVELQEPVPQPPEPGIGQMAAALQQAGARRRRRSSERST